MPAFGQVLFEVTEGAQAQLPPDVCCVFFFDKKHLPQSLDFILHLYSREIQTKNKHNSKQKP